MEKIFEKIQKLMALQFDAEKQGSLEEAANAASKVQDLLMKHNLDMATVNGFEKEEMHKTTVSARGTGWNKRQGTWMMSLFNGIAEYNFCAIVSTKEPQGREVRLHILGEPSNVEIVEYLSVQLSHRLLNMQEQAWKHYRGEDLKGTFRRGYLSGATMGIISTLREQQEAQMAANEAVSALVLVKSEKVDDYMHKVFPSLTTSRRRVRTKSTAIGQGFKDGKALGIHKGVPGKDSIKLN